MTNNFYLIIIMNKKNISFNKIFVNLYIIMTSEPNTKESYRFSAFYLTHIGRGSNFTFAVVVNRQLPYNCNNY